MIIGLISMLLLSASAGADDASPATVLAVHCKAEWRHSAQDRTQPLKGTLKHLQVGESVRCSTKGSIELYIYGRRVVFTHPEVWYPIPDSAPSDQTAQERRRAEAFEKITKRAGRDRSPGSPTYAVTPENMVLLWRPDSGPLLAEVEIPGEPPWKKLLDDRSGRLHSDELQQLLTNYAKRGGGAFHVRYSDKHGDRTEQILLVLSEERQHQLSTEMALWNGEPDLMKHLGLAATLLEADMPEEAGKEYEAAMNVTSYSRDLALTAVYAYRRAGDYVRERMILQKLPAGTALIEKDEN